MQLFKHNLIISGISASVRKSRGTDIKAACGLLASGFKEYKRHIKRGYKY
jgi:adenine C2-methylase RlmN of 23S rRNA A2503 and tRNA A37